MSTDTAVLTPVAAAPAVDPRVAAFCNPNGPEVFHAVAHNHEIWRPDPCDVESVHREARDIFERMLTRAISPEGTPAGRILLVLGESGSGKTHLMRAFRNLVHGRKAGFCGYVHMATQATNYGRYFHESFLDSLEQPYYQPHGDATGLTFLGNGLIETLSAVTREEMQELRNWEMSRDELTLLVHKYADYILLDERYRDEGADLDLVRALLYLQRDDNALRNRVVNYLRCRDLSAFDRQALGGLVPRLREEDPLRVLELLGRLIRRVTNGSLVLFIDQMEDINQQFADSTERYKRIMTEACSLAEHVPAAIIVIACMEDVYAAIIRKHVYTSHLDRIERDPDPVRLSNNRTPKEVQELVRRRLQVLYEYFEVPWNAVEPTFPIPDTLLREVHNSTTRLVLDRCRTYRDQCMAAGKLVSPTGPSPTIAPLQPSLDLQQSWNDIHQQQAAPSPDATEEELAAILAQAISHCSEEVTHGGHFAAQGKQNVLEVETHDAVGNLERKFLVAVCNKSAKGGGLKKQLEAVRKQAKEIPLVLVRRESYPNLVNTEVGKFITQLVANPHHRLRIEDGGWRTMLAMCAFLEKHKTHPQLKTWLQQEQPLHNVPALRHILDLDAKRTEVVKLVPPSTLVPQPSSPKPVPAKTPAPVAEKGEEPQPSPANTCSLGITVGLQPRRVTIAPKELRQHAVFLGGTGSGKTTLALNLVEQLLLRGVPAVLVDRKGDLCCYARPEFREQPPSLPQMDERWRQLRERVDVRLYTPGKPSGKPLALPLMPEGLGALQPDERHAVAKQAASALGGMMGYKPGNADKYGAILGETLEFLAELQPQTPVTLPLLIEALQNPEASLLDRLQGRTKHLDKLVEGLQTLKYNQQALLSDDAPRLDADLLFGKGRHAVPGRTRLSILSTKFLGDDASLQFWVAQLLMELTRWLSRNPSNDLQAVLLLDESDLYMPATRKPVSKEPLESLLKRARSGGLGIFLASQSPGDFDYKGRENLRTWFLGKITQVTALDKLKMVVGEGRQALLGKLAAQDVGHFVMVQESSAQQLKGDRSVMETQQLSEEEIVRLAQKPV
jgi:energy-coupling factor transporter ATP-binding protein EcfA2